MAKTCVKLFDYIQTLPPETQLLALAAAFVLMSEALGFPTADAYTAVTNLMKDVRNASGRDYRFDAMMYHLREDFADGQQ